MLIIKVFLLIVAAMFVFSKPAWAAEQTPVASQPTLTPAGKIVLPARKAGGLDSGGMTIGEVNCSRLLHMEDIKKVRGEPVADLKVNRKSIACGGIPPARER